MPQYSLSTDSWDLHRRAEKDRQRHNEKVKEVIKKNLGDIISQQGHHHGGKWQNRENPRARNRIAAHPLRQRRARARRAGRRAEPSPAIFWAAPHRQQEGTGKEAGQEPGVDFYDAELTIEELTSLVFEDLHLPNLEDRGIKQILSEHAGFQQHQQARHYQQSRPQTDADGGLQAQRPRRQTPAGRCGTKTAATKLGKWSRNHSATP